MPDQPTYSSASIPVRHAGEDALRQLEALAAEWIARQHQRVAAAS